MKIIAILFLETVSFLSFNYPPAKENKRHLLQLSTPGDVVGKVTVGYQGWFSAEGDGSPLNSWGHQNLEHWPDVRQYKNTYAGSPFAQGPGKQPPFTGNLRNGQPAKMFSSDDQQVSDTHCLWMQQNGIDCIALQRFGSYLKPGSQVKDFHDAVDIKMMNAAQKYGRKFYIMYDCSATSPVAADWTNTIVNEQHLTSSPAYAHQNGKPVVCLWGVGKSGRGKNVSDWVNTINWFKAQGCYVIGGPLEGFSTDTANQAAYDVCDMIMPWMVGKTKNFGKYYTDDLAYCSAHGIDYQADIYPGTAFFNTNGARSPKNQIPRKHGDFMWAQFAAARNAGVKSVYISMFDEINEATGILNCAEDSLSTPAGKYMLTLDADGVHVSSDFYLRMVKDGADMIKAITAYRDAEPTPFVLTPPVSVKPRIISGRSVQISWSPVTGSPCYNIKRSTNQGGPYTTIAAGINGETYTNTGLAANKTYYYVVSAGHINGGESADSEPISTKTNRSR
jgi:hypothetical protein